MTPMGGDANMTEQQLQEIESRLENLEWCQDFGWYWVSYGEKCYAFATISAFPAHEEDEDRVPAPCLLEPHPTDDRLLVANDGTEMLADDCIVQSERQSGDYLCEYVAHSRNDIRDLIDEVRRLNALVADIRSTK